VEPDDMSDWDARQYLKFERERTRAAVDLLAQVEGSARLAVDVGCGPGNSTELLAARFPEAELLGVDNSDDMLAKARKRLPAIKFSKADIANWRGAVAPDVVFANAVMQWIPRHIDVMKRIVDQLAPGGRLAAQMPDNWDEPTHRLMRDTASLPRFAAKLAKAEAARDPVGAFEDYYAALAPTCARIDLWRTTYAHVLAGPEAIVEWVKGTGLRPFLDPLDETEKRDFLAHYSDAIASAYAPQADGRVLLRFPRVFVIAVKSGGDEN
jgi:trans-aconitate 2-methyltransferase